MKYLILLFVIIGIVSCSSQKEDTSDTIKEPPKGAISREALFTEFPAWADEMERYRPDSLLIDSLRQDYDIDIEIFFGTWCSDSRREVPRFFKILDQSQFVKPDRVKLWAVDKSKKLENNLAEKRDIEYVATFIFLRDGKEIGRIIERPQESLELDILRIITARK
jgi:hypothetical protein